VKAANNYHTDVVSIPGFPS